MLAKLHSNKRLNSGSFNLKILSAAVASALFFSNAYAAGLGKLSVLSSLGQPLRAEIELTSVSKEEAGSLSAKLASPEAYRQANVDFGSSLSALRFSVEQRGTRHFIRVSSAQPLNEPFVDMLLELAGPDGRLIREYTFLLDPADMRATQNAQVSPAVTSVPDTSKLSAPAPRAEAAPDSSAEKSARSSQPAATPVTKSIATEKNGRNPAEGYQVKSGDSLSKIASQFKPNGISLDQMLVALHRANPNAFVGNNMNRLRAGQILSVPGADAASSISKADAQREVRAQSADFSNYRNKLAGRVANAEPKKSADSGRQSAGGKIAAKVDEPATPANDAQDKLKLAKPNTAPSNANADKGVSAAARIEEKIANEKALAEANARVQELEKNVNDLQKILEVKNKALAEQQQQASVSKLEESTPATSSQSLEKTPITPPVSSTVTTDTKPAETQFQKSVPPIEQKKPTPPTPAGVKKTTSVPETSFMDELIGNPLTLPGVGVLLVGLGALGIYSARRRKQDKSFEDSIISDSSLKANSLFGSTGGQSVDTNNSVFNSNFSPSASQLNTNEVDPVAEADVYIAYGRDAQAEEILKEALRTQPDRNAVRVKLLEIYANRKDLRAFEVLATELYGLTKGEGEDWEQAASLGIGIDPNNPLYASGKSVEATEDRLLTPTQLLEDNEALSSLMETPHPDDSLNASGNALDVNTAYFSNTTLATEMPLENINASLPDPLPELKDAPAADASAAFAKSPEVEKPISNEIDFNLDDLTLPSNDGEESIKRPPRPQPKTAAEGEIPAIDFSFLNEDKKESASFDEPEIPLIADVSPSVEKEAVSKDVSRKSDAEMSPLDFDLPLMSDEFIPDVPKKEARPSADPLDFDLSDINLELNHQNENSSPDDLALDTLDGDAENGTLSPSDAEMATKLDLAVAYQEIGDKEGARELLDEVLKGGTPAQSQRAKTLLLELA